MNELLLENNKENMQLIEVQNKQKNFLDTTFGKAINNAINYGLKKILPDFIEDSVIEIKDTIFKDGIIDGIKNTINKLADLGKSAVGTITGTFNKITQMEAAVDKGGIIDSASKIIDKQIKNIKEKEILPENVTKIISEGKKTIKNNLKENIKEELKEQKNLLTKVNRYEKEWNKAYEENNLEKMQKIYDKMVELKNDVIPIEEIDNKISKIENINNLIKNKNTFKLSEMEIELAGKL